MKTRREKFRGLFINMRAVATALLPLVLLLPFYGSAEAAEPITYKYNIVHENDTSFKGRKRVQAIISSSELPAEHREIFLKDIAEEYHEQGYDLSQVILTPVKLYDHYHLFGRLGDVTYTPDGCGNSGRDCNGEQWKVSIAKHELTQDELAYIEWFEELRPSIIGNKLEDSDDIDEESRLYKELNGAIGEQIGKSAEEAKMIQFGLMFFK